MTDDQTYFAGRAAAERSAAMAASHPNAQQAHLELAERYQFVADALARRSPSPMPRLVDAA